MSEFKIALNWEAKVMLDSYAAANNISCSDAVTELLIKNLIEGVGLTYEKTYSTYARMCRVYRIG